MKKLLATAGILVFGVSTFAQAQDADATLESLLERVRNGRVVESTEHKKREAEFISRRNEQQQLLQQANAEQARLERESARLEAQRTANEQEIATQLETRRNREGQLSELFGVLQQSAGDALAVIKTSHATIGHPNRLEEIQVLIDKASDDAKLPTIDEIRAWPGQMMFEMIESRKIVTNPQTVKLANGTQVEADITRIGDFAVVGNDKFFLLKDGGKIEEVGRQPAGYFTSTIGAFQTSTKAVDKLALDPTRGQLLTLEIRKSTFEDRIEQGGPIGYLILILGAIGTLMAVVQWLYLMVVKSKVRSQIKSGTPNTNNPLGRVLSVYAANPRVDVETLELKLDEAILKETPALERFLNLIKLISAVAPLFGLLGTVTGMIETFQAITLFGSGDTNAMAAGISTALVTTVEGLVVAIPTLLLHSFVAGASKSVIHVLEEQSAGIIAVHAEKENAHAGAQ